VLWKYLKSTLNDQHNKAHEVPERIHYDVYGPFSTTYTVRQKYFVIFIDDFSRKCWIFFTWKKNETFSMFIEFKTLIEKELSRRWKFCCSDCNNLQNFGIHLNFGAYYGYCDRSFLSHLLVSWWSQAPLFNLKSCSCFYLYIECVIFGHQGYRLSCKGRFVLLQGEIFMSSPHRHVSQSYTIVTFILPKSIIGAALT